MIQLSNPILISGHTRSGTNLLMRLIDGTPGVSVPPGEGKLNTLRRFLDLDYPLEGDPESLAEEISNQVELNLEGPEKAAFHSALREEVSRHESASGYIDTIAALLRAVSRFVTPEPGRGGPEAPLRWLEKNHNLEFYWNRATFLFGRPKLLFVMRDPLDNWLSWQHYMATYRLNSSVRRFAETVRRHCVNEIAEATFGPPRFVDRAHLLDHYGVRFDNANALAAWHLTPALAEDVETATWFDPAAFPWIHTAEGRFAWNYRLMYEKAADVQRATPGDVLIVRYEELVLDTRSAMRDVMTFLGSTSTEANLTPTECGRTWSGNSSFRSAPRVGVDATRLGRGLSSLPEEEVDHIRDIVQDVPGTEGHFPAPKQ